MSGVRLGALDPRWARLQAAAGGFLHPTGAEFADLVAKALEESGAPEIVREYVRERILGTRDLKQGRPGLTDAEKGKRAWITDYEVRLRQAAFRIQKKNRPRERAVAVVARIQGVSPDTVEARIKRELPRAARTSLESANEHLQELEEMGLIQLDPESGYRGVT